MAINLLVGTLIISITVMIHTFGLMAVTHTVGLLTARFRMHGKRSRILAMNSVVIGLFAILSVEIWLWAIVYDFLGVVADFPTALYFSTSTFSTVGYGDVVAAQSWRLLAALQAVNGFLLIGWSTAYLVSAGIRVGPFRSGEHF